MSPSSGLVETVALHGTQHSAQRDLDLCKQAEAKAEAGRCNAALPVRTPRAGCPPDRLSASSPWPTAAPAKAFTRGRTKVRDRPEQSPALQRWRP
jgi:hypothetical protein